MLINEFGSRSPIGVGADLLFGSGGQPTKIAEVAPPTSKSFRIFLGEMAEVNLFFKRWSDDPQGRVVKALNR